MTACLEYVESTDAVIGHTDVMAEEFVRRGLRRIAVTDATRESKIGVYVLTERASEPRVAQLIEALRVRAATVLPPLGEAV